MKFEDGMAVPALAVGFLLGLLTGILFGMQLQKRTRSNIDDVNWVLSRDWTMTETNKTAGIEFGFRQDGYMMWRKSSK